MKDWTGELDPVLREYMESLISETAISRKAYLSAKNRANAQVWVALAILSRENAQLSQENKNLKELMSALSQKYKFLEKVVRELNPKKMQKDDEDPAKALKDVLKRL